MKQAALHSKEDVADPEMQKSLPSVAIPVGRMRCQLLSSLTLCLLAYYSFWLVAQF